jgi:hypothetical protein
VNQALKKPQVGVSSAGVAVDLTAIVGEDRFSEADGIPEGSPCEGTVRTMRLPVVLAGLAVGVVSMLGTVAGAWAVPPVQIAGSIQGNDPIADCGSFEVWDEFTLSWRGTEHYDQDGNIVRVVEHVWGVDRLYNPDNGKSLDPATFNQGEAVDLVEGQVKVSGVVFRITVPGSGAVFLDVGRYIIDFDEGLVFLAGQHQFFEGDLDGLCAALS